MNTARHPAKSNLASIIWKSAVGLGFTAAVVVLLMMLAGAFARKIDAQADHVPPVAGRPVPANVQLAEAAIIRTPRIESAVGTIEAVHKAAVAAKLLAKVVAVNAQAGQAVSRGDVLVQLDDQDLQAAVRQAQAIVASAQAQRDQAKIEYDRVKGLYDQGIEAKTAFDQADTALKTAGAEVERAEQAVVQSQTMLGYATITSPIDGLVVDKLVEVGDTASPGQVLLNLYDPSRMQLVASVRESLTHRLKIGEPIGVRVDALGKTCEGRVSEIVPEAESASRTFAVKVTGPCPPGIYSGMFGRLLIPLDQEERLVIPATAVRKVGQLDLVDVVEELASGQKLLRRRTVQLGERLGEHVEVLSGLRVGETVALPAAG